MKELTILKEELKKRKLLFAEFRISNGNISKKAVLNKIAQKNTITAIPNEKISITQKMKNVLFGKKYLQ